VTLGDESGIVDAFVKNHPHIRVGNTINLKHCEVIIHNEHIQVQLMDNGKVELSNYALQQLNLKNNISKKSWM
jgi:hypothetical protein